MNRILLLLTFIVLVSTRGQAQTASRVQSAALWSVQEFSFVTSAPRSNHYVETDLKAVFTGPAGVRQIVRGFWDGGNTFKIRFTPTAVGRWSYTTESSDKNLNAKRGSFVCTKAASGARGFLRRDPAHPYHFIFDDGTRHFMFGTTYYGLMQNAMAGERWKEAVDKARAYGINKVRMVVAPPFGSRHEKVKYPAASGFVADDRDRPDPAHWRRLDEVVRYMAERGITADLILYWNSDRSYGTPAQDECFTRYCISRYAAYPNVVWCITNEWNYTPKPIEYWNRMGTLAKAEDPYAARGDYLRLLSIHQQTRHDFQFFDQTWLSHAIVQLGVRNQGKTFRSGNEWKANNAAEEGRTFRHGDEWGNFSITYNWGHNMPIVNDEYGYIGEPQDQSMPKDAAGNYPRLTRDKHRHIMWGIAAASGYAAAGDKNSYTDGAPYFSANWHDAPEYADIKHLVDFWTNKNIEYWKLGTNNALVKHGTRVYATAEAGRQYVIYAAAGGAFALNLPKGDYVARRFDPRTGADVALRDVRGGVQDFTMPDNQDWVIYLRARSTNARRANKN
ncbi:MAG TPA: DUF4038 domain-containing protein [Pyrinomonadaceae bacterium]|nr:DUF4038 domain-containing protein [Pyrinomonadaceae bacterium]